MAPSVRASTARSGGASHRAGGRRSGCRPATRRRPSRCEAGQHSADTRQHRQARRPRVGGVAGRRQNRSRPGRHRRLHAAGASHATELDRSSFGHLFIGSEFLSSGNGPNSVSRNDAHGGDLEARQGNAAAGARTRAEPAAGSVGGDSAHDGQTQSDRYATYDDLLLALHRLHGLLAPEAQRPIGSGTFRMPHPLAVQGGGQ